MSLFYSKRFIGVCLTQSKIWSPYNGLQALEDLTLCELSDSFPTLLPALFSPCSSHRASLPFLKGTDPLAAWDLWACSPLYLKTLFLCSLVQFVTLLPSGCCSNITLPKKPFLTAITWHLSSLFKCFSP